MYARGVVVWKETGRRLEREARFYLGVKFDPDFLDLGLRLVKQGRLKRLIGISLPTVLIAALIFSFLVGRENKKLIRLHRQYVRQLLEASQAAALQKEELNKKKTAVGLLRERLQRQEKKLLLARQKLRFWQEEYRQALQAEKMLGRAEAEMSSAEKKKLRAEQKIAELQKELESLSVENKNLTAALSKATAAQKTLEAASAKVNLKLRQAEQISIDDMYEWIKVHQNLRTGLIASFEGDNYLADWAFTYDQALAVIVFTVVGNYEAAQRILDFYLEKAATYRQGYLNAYYATEGDVCEYVAHAGPNIWMGLAALNFMKASGSKKYLPIALRVAKFVMSLQDSEGGIRGGPAVKWYSTEHNLDAYALLYDFYLLTQRNFYLKQA